MNETREEWEALLAQATKLGEEAGAAAGTWVFDGNTDAETYRSVLQGYEDGDPAILDMQPAPLSGEWASDPIPQSIYDALGVENSGDNTSDLLDAYEQGFADGFWTEVIRAARYQLDPPKPETHWHNDGSGPYAHGHVRAEGHGTPYRN